MIALKLVSYTLFLFALGYYFITNLQWYSYRLNRVLFHHTKVWWHVTYFLIPLLLFMVAMRLEMFCIGVSLGYSALLVWWVRGLDKPLVFTGRVKRFFVALLFAALFLVVVFQYYGVVFPLFLAFGVSLLVEKMLFHGFVRQAKKRLDAKKEMIVVGITASYGKTSIKNFIAHLLSAKYTTYATPRSVNTFAGVVRDINEDLPENTEVYVVEMGARGEGDIKEISTFVNPHYVVVGKIGPAHIEYFKTMENIRNTKMEILQTERLTKAWVHESAMVKPEERVKIFGSKEHLDIRQKLPAPEYMVEEVEATLDATRFSLEGTTYSASILGAFNAMNLAVAVLVAKELGLNDEEIQKGLSTLAPVAHRLQRIDAGGKVILDDSFNGNIDGMMAAFDLATTHQGRKVVITPGLVEADDALNVEVAQRANEVFDTIVVTGDLNYAIFKAHVDADKLVKLGSKSEMEQMLVEQTNVGDLVLFANDAPSFV
jgi:UDP-N-acetylmuramoyl-tripeptide--D-alanyl-D-alanine ligase